MIRALIRALICGLWLSAGAPVRSQALPPDSAQLAQAFGKTPLFFERNEGQFDRRAKFMARGAGYGLFLTATDAVLSLRKDAPKLETRLPGQTEPLALQGPPLQPSSAVLRMRLVGGNTKAHVKGLAPLPGKSNYFIGNDRSHWRTAVEQFSRVKYAQVYPGIDLVYYGNQKQLEYDFVVAPGADTRAIRMRFEGAQRIEVNRRGELVLHTRGGQVVQHAPVVYQQVEGKRRAVAGRYQVLSAREVGFAIGAYDPHWPLVIDPIIAFSTYIGGSGLDSSGGIIRDSSGNLYLSGSTKSTNLPAATNAYGGGDYDVFVTKLSSNGGVLFSMYIGGSGNDTDGGITSDSSGNLYLSGNTASPNLPAATNAYSGGGYYDAFVTKLSSTGSVLFSTYVGGSGNDTTEAIRTDSSGNLYITGSTYSTNLPAATNAYGGSGDAFVTKLSSTGSVLFSTYVGGSNYDYAGGIIRDGSGNLYIVGHTGSTNLPAATNAYSGGYDVFVTKLSNTGSVLFSTYIGGSGDDYGGRIISDSSGNLYIAGSTASPNLPAATNAYSGGYYDIFVTKLSSNGGVLFSTYVGGSALDYGGRITSDSSGNLYITGSTASPNLPAATNAYGGGDDDAFVTKLSSNGGVLFSMYIGGTGSDGGSDITSDGSDNLYLSGGTSSTDLPAATNAYGGGQSDVFVTKIILDQIILDRFALTIEPSTFSEAAGANAAIGTVTRTGATAQALSLTLSSSNTNAATVPASITIPAGQTSASFAIAAVDNFVVDGAKTVTITARVGGMESALANATVTDNEAVNNGSVTGKVLLPSTQSSLPLPGVTLTLRRGTTLLDTTTSSTNGSYSFRGLPAGAYTVTAAKVGYSFSPTSVPVSLSTTSMAVANVNFTGTLQASITGRVLRRNPDGSYSGVGRVYVFARGVTVDLTYLARTDDAGYYKFERLGLATYFVAPDVTGTFFNPRLRSIGLSSAKPKVAEVNFLVGGRDTLVPTVAVNTPDLQNRVVTGTNSDRGEAGVSFVTAALARFSSAGATTPQAFWVWKDNRWISTDDATYVERTGVQNAQRTTWKVDRLPTLPPGFYGIRATAVDGAGNRGHSPWKRFTVAAPVVRVSAGDTEEGGMAPTSTVRLSIATARSGDASFGDDSITLQFTGALDEVTARDASSYTVLVRGQAVVVESVSYRDNTVMLGLPDGVMQVGDPIEVSWHNLRDARQRLIPSATQHLTLR